MRWGTQQLASSPARTDLHTGEGTEPLEGRNVARLESEMFFSHALSTTTPDTVESLFRSCVARRLRGEPTAYILGQRQFWGFDFTVSPATLIPRPDTETMIDAALSLYTTDRPPQRILDLGTGSGCILLSLLSEFKEARGVGVDRSPQALQVARINAHRMRLTERCTFIESDWLDKVDGSERFDLVASNPPYIPRADLASLEPDVKDFEPAGALDGGEDGLQVYRHFASSDKLDRVMAPGAFLLLEVGAGQASQVAELFHPKRRCIAVKRDLAGVERCLVLQ